MLGVKYVHNIFIHKDLTQSCEIIFKLARALNLFTLVQAQMKSTSELSGIQVNLALLLWKDIKLQHKYFHYT